jgi:hypothetical protein
MCLDLGQSLGDDEPKRKSMSKLPRKAVWDRDHGTCQLCGKPARYSRSLRSLSARSTRSSLAFAFLSGSGSAMLIVSFPPRD